MMLLGSKDGSCAPREASQRFPERPGVATRRRCGSSWRPGRPTSPAGTRLWRTLGCRRRRRTKPQALEAAEIREPTRLPNGTALIYWHLVWAGLGDEVMKCALALVAAIALGACTPAAFAADNAAGPPEYVGVFEAMSPAGAFVALERQTGQQRMKVRLMGFAGASAGYQVEGEHSPVRLSAGSAAAFVVRTASQDTDPATLVQFFSMHPLGGKRVLDLSKAGAMGLTQHDETGMVSVNFSAQKYGSNYFIVRPLKPLSPGEYALGTSASNDFFLFGVD